MVTDCTAVIVQIPVFVLGILLCVRIVNKSLQASPSNNIWQCVNRQHIALRLILLYHTHTALCSVKHSEFVQTRE